MNPRTLPVVLCYLILLSAVAVAQDINPPKDSFDAPKREYSPYVDDHFPNRVLFGDTHLHSSWSTDAGMAGATLGPDVAYRVSFCAISSVGGCHGSRVPWEESPCVSCGIMRTAV